MTDHDVVVIGGGPGGCALATFCAKNGYRTAIFEKREFPRFRIGESLVPAVNVTLDKLGVLDRMDARGFPRKHGVQFYSPTGPTKPFYFSEVDDPRMHSTWQVLRSEFDAMLVDNARENGVTIHTQTEVTGLIETDDLVTGATIRNGTGDAESVTARVVVDASGQSTTIARQRGGRRVIENLRNSSVFAHYRDVQLDTGIDAGSTLIFRLEGLSWLWFIPLGDVVSIGLVSPVSELPRFGVSAEEMLKNAIAESGPLSERLANATRVSEVRAARDFSYRMEHDGGNGWLLVGDAVGFIDPIYSTGLLLTMLSADLGAQAIHRALQDDGTPQFAGYSKEYQAAFEQFHTLVQAFYTQDFRFGGLARNPIHRQGLVDLLTGVVGTDAADEVTRTIRAFFAD